MAGRSGGRNWVPGLFAAFWILLAVFSAAYLFRIITEPQANRETASASTAAPATSSAPLAPSSLPTDQAQTLVQANEAKDQEIGQLKAEVRDLSGQVTELSNRLKPLEKVLGPVAALPSSTAVTTSPPSPEPVNPSVAEPAPPPSAAAAEPKPASQPKQTPAAEATRNPPEDNTTPDQESNDTAGPATSEEPSQSTETANLTPSSIPPGTTRFGIEIGSVAKQDEIRPMWRSLLTDHAALVAGLQARRVIAPDKKWRLIAGPFSSAAEAMQACGLFKKADMPCEATVFAGDPF